MGMDLVIELAGGSSCVTGSRSLCWHEMLISSLGVFEVIAF
jgi:hypothetical protein